MHDAFFDTVLARVPGRAARLVAAARDRGVTCASADPDEVGICCDETTTRRRPRRRGRGLRRAKDARRLDADGEGDGRRCLRRCCGRRRSSPTRSSTRHHSETAMLRYLRRLADRDFALDRGMIPLGSCTMKLNATAEMVPSPGPSSADLHPFAPADQAEGYPQLIADLESWLAEITGYDAVCLQPNAGSQGEFAGCWPSGRTTASRGEGHRDVCLIPSSARTAPTPPARRWPGCRSSWSPATRTATSTSTTCAPSRRARRAARRPDGHLPVHPRRLRGGHRRHLRTVHDARRAGLHRRRQHERAGRARPARASSARTSAT